MIECYGICHGVDGNPLGLARGRPSRFTVMASRAAIFDLSMKLVLPYEVETCAIGKGRPLEYSTITHALNGVGASLRAADILPRSSDPGTTSSRPQGCAFGLNVLYRDDLQDLWHEVEIFTEYGSGLDNL